MMDILVRKEEFMWVLLYALIVLDGVILFILLIWGLLMLFGYAYVTGYYIFNLIIGLLIAVVILFLAFILYINLTK